MKELDSDFLRDTKSDRCTAVQEQPTILILIVSNIGDLEIQCKFFKHISAL